MTAEWAEAKNKEHDEKITVLRKQIIDAITVLPKATDEQKKALIKHLRQEEQSGRFCMTSVVMSRVIDYQYDEALSYNDIKQSYERTFPFTEFDILVRERGMYSRYIDSAPVHFDGDIIITDPCYIMAKDSPNDWDICDYGYQMESLGIKTYMTHDTLYGDWGCTTFDVDSCKPIGEFCADAGLVSVFLLDEVLAYNPFFNNHLKKKWTTTLIENFKGDVQFVIERVTGQYEHDIGHYKAGDVWEDYELHVVGHGINKTTGKPINFRTTQTGL